MNNYPNFIGKKFRSTGELESRLDSYTNERVYYEKLGITKSYKKYLLLKQLAELEFDCKVLKHKIELQQKEYNEIDSIDFSEYQYKLKEYYRILAIVTK